jgi:DNA (cytosine-5)-methyltransferase 1
MTRSDRLALVLSLFPGIDLLGLAFEQEWPDICIVRGPDLIFNSLSDIQRFHPPAGRFDGVIGGPPCQAFSRLRHIVEANGYKTAPNLIPEFERCVAEAQPAWFLMENVPAAPEPSVPGYVVRSILYNNRWAGGEQNRQRRFSFGTRDGRELQPEMVALEAAEWAPAVLASGTYRSTPVKIGGSGKVKRTAIAAADVASRRGVIEALRLQGLPADFFAHSPFTIVGQQCVLGNGVPLPMGRAIARAVRAARGLPAVEHVEEIA